MTYRLSWSGCPGVFLGVLVAGFSASAWAKPLKRAPDELILREAKDLKDQYDRLYDEGKYSAGMPLAERSCSLLEKVHGGLSEELVGCINDLSSLHREQGEYVKAEALTRRALAIGEKMYGDDHPLVGETLTYLGRLHEAQGAYEESEMALRRALAIFETMPDPDFVSIASAAHDLAFVYYDQGRLEEAESLFARALLGYEGARRPMHVSVATVLNDLALVYVDQGRLEDAEPLYKRALAIYEEVLGGEHPHVAAVLNNLGQLHLGQGAYEDARRLHERALSVREKAFGPEHPSVAISIGNLAKVYYHQEEYVQAGLLLERSLALFRRTLLPGHPHTAAALSNLANVRNAQGLYGEARVLYEEALSVYQAALGPRHTSVAMVLNSLAFLNQNIGSYEEAKVLYERALEICEGSAGSCYSSIDSVLGNMAKLYYDQGEYEMGLAFHERALDVEEEGLVRALVVADERRRLDYASMVSASLEHVLSLHARAAPGNDSIAALALTTLSRRKSRVQDLVAQSNASLRRSLSEDDGHLLDDLAAIDSRVALLSLRGAGRLTADALTRQLDELRGQRERLWDELAKHSSVVDAYNRPVTIEDIQRSLPPGSALIELAQYIPRHDDAGVRLRKHEPKPPARYAAYLVFPDRFDWVDLGPAAPIDEHIEDFRRALQTKQAIPPDLYDAVMRPIVDELGSAHRLVIAPAGALSLVPFGALHDGDRYLVERYDLRYVTTGRDLLDPPAAPPVTTTPVTVVANPTGAFLTDAETEADFLERIFPDTEVLLDDQATETNVRTIERPIILHLATHGFFGRARNDRDNPMFRSGLYLADVERVQVDRERDDGRLTAYEVSGMDLRGTQLVVLSACETGMGAVDMSEGVFGLRRAFAIAGAGTTVMSLWAVSGVTTQTMMASYYRKLAEGLGRGEAMQAVQLEMLRSKNHAHPKDWAAFIVSGEDTPMDFSSGQEPRMEPPPSTDDQAPPPVGRPHGCSLATPSPAHDRALTLLLSMLSLGAARRRRR